MIELITLFDVDRIPYDGSPTFREDADYMWRSLDTVANSMNVSIEQMNVDFESIKGYESSALESKESAIQSAAEAQQSAEIAITLANYKGDYNSENTYNAGECVTFQDFRYVSKIDNNSTEPTPKKSTEEWYFFKQNIYTYINIDNNYAPTVWDYLKCDTINNTIRVTLPATPNENDRVGFVDIKGTFETNNLTVEQNGNLIMGKDEPLTASNNNMSFELIFNDGDWRLI